MSEKLLQIVCGQCKGQMRIQRTGEAVECPHCKTHLLIPTNVVFGAEVQAASESGVYPTVADVGQARLASPNKPPGVSRTLFIAVASYASAITAALIWALVFRSENQLESLPDIRPLEEGEFQFVGFDADLPEKHTLRIGESRRFGDVNVRAARITREPVTYTHYRNPDITRPPTQPVLKLWLELTNRATNVAFSPIDSELVSRRVADGMDVKSNTFLRVAGQKVPLGFNLEHAAMGEWNMDDQLAGELLQPGQSQLVYVASDEETAAKVTSRTDEIIWRVQLRKGICPSLRQGVTTLVDIAFHKDDIRNE